MTQAETLNWFQKKIQIEHNISALERVFTVEYLKQVKASSHIEFAIQPDWFFQGGFFIFTFENNFNLSFKVYMPHHIFYDMTLWEDYLSKNLEETHF